MNEDVYVEMSVSYVHVCEVPKRYVCDRFTYLRNVFYLLLLYKLLDMPMSKQYNLLKYIYVI